MGIPAAFRWLSNKYPKIVSPVVEEHPIVMDDGSTIPVDNTRPNPNGEEFDNLYLDMNGIVHPCSHPEDRPAPKDEEEMMLEVFKYTDRVVSMTRPRKLLMIAIGESELLPYLGRFVLTIGLCRRCCSTCEDEPATFKTFPRRARGKGKGSRQGGALQDAQAAK